MSSAKQLAYYNEWDPYAAQWLRNLIDANLIAPGDVDERSIADVRPDDVAGYRQCHWFAGIGGWSLAARLAGWPDSRELWTGSAPCQPYSVAGKGLGRNDPRDLWPHYFRLIKARRPAVAMGEQVAAAISKHWLDRVFDDLEDAGYSCEASVVPACAVNAPHRRNRLWFVADADSWRIRGERPGAAVRASRGVQVPNKQRERFRTNTRSAYVFGRGDVVHTERARLEGYAGNDRAAGGRTQPGRSAAATGRGSLVADANEHGCESRDVAAAPSGHWRPAESEGGANAWDSASWINGHDGKARRVGTSFRRMVDGFSCGLGRLRADIHAKTVKEVIRYGQETFTGCSEVMRSLWLCVHAQPAAYWKVGEQAGICGAEILLAYLCQLDRRSVESYLPLPGTQEFADAMLRVRADEQAARASHGRHCVEQRAGEYPDALHALSRILASHAQEAWASYCRTDAAPMRLLEHGVPARVGKLRAYGNAIVPQVSAEIIGAYMDCAPERISV